MLKKLRKMLSKISRKLNHQTIEMIKKEKEELASPEDNTSIEAGATEETTNQGAEVVVTTRTMRIMRKERILENLPLGREAVAAIHLGAISEVIEEKEVAVEIIALEETAVMVLTEAGVTITIVAATSRGSLDTMKRPRMMNFLPNSKSSFLECKKNILVN